MGIIMAFLLVSSVNNITALSAANLPVNPLYDPLLPVLTSLALCESSNNPLAVNPHDPITPSYGLYQFKEATWNFYINKYHLFPNSEPTERMNFIWDRSSQEVVARLILHEKNGWRNWTNCLRWYYE